MAQVQFLTMACYHLKNVQRLSSILEAAGREYMKSFKEVNL